MPILPFQERAVVQEYRRRVMRGQEQIRALQAYGAAILLGQCPASKQQPPHRTSFPESRLLYEDKTLQLSYQ